MVSMHKVWEVSRKEIVERGALIDRQQQLLTRAVKDIGYHVDYSEDSPKYYDHDVLRSQKEYIKETQVEHWKIAKELGVELHT